MSILSADDVRASAKARLPHFLFEYIDGGSFDEVSCARNIADLRSVELPQKVLQDVSDIRLSTELLGERLSMPLVLGPIGLAGMSARRGECQAARAASAAGVPFVLSTVSACSISEVAAASSVPFWFQLYMIRDRAFMERLLEQARLADCRVLVFTVDMPVPGTRYRDHRSGLAGAPGLAGATRRFFQASCRPRWAWDVGLRGRPHSLGNVAPVLGPKSGLEDFMGWMRDNFEPGISWDDIRWIRDRWDGPIVLKGILDPDDARQAVDAGVDGIVVSNHGGRQLDGAISTARALPPIFDAVGGQTTIFVDGGVRSGLDVVRMLALGANAVFLGRAWAFALAAGGQKGVADMLSRVRAEMEVTMALMGVSVIGDIIGMAGKGLRQWAD